MVALEESFSLIEVERLTRSEFITEVFGPHYEKGQHVTFIGPTGCGKTTVAYEMMNEVASSELPAIILVMKPRDDTVKDWSKLSGFKKTETWPPTVNRGLTKKSGGFMKKRRGWVYWPRHSLSDIKRDDEFLAKQFRKVLSESYKKGDRIIFADEVVGLSKELHLEQELNAIWMRGRSMGCGLWAATQRPFHAPVLMYSAAEHLILFKDADKRNIDRFKEIGGIDPIIVEETVKSLNNHEFFYIGRNMGKDGVSPAYAIVEARGE